MVSFNVPKYKIRTTRWIGPWRIIFGTIIHDNGVKCQIVLLKLRWHNKSGQRKWIIKLKRHTVIGGIKLTLQGWGEGGGGGNQRKMGADTLWADIVARQAGGSWMWEGVETGGDGNERGDEAPMG
jgi:hypothetical protein